MICRQMDLKYDYSHDRSLKLEIGHRPGTVVQHCSTTTPCLFFFRDARKFTLPTVRLDGLMNPLFGTTKKAVHVPMEFRVSVLLWTLLALIAGTALPAACSANLRVLWPLDIAGEVPYSMAAFGPSLIQPKPFRGIVVPVRDAPATGCMPLVSATRSQAEQAAQRARYHGRILLVSRGECSFARKALIAQQAGAQAVIVANSDVSSGERAASPLASSLFPNSSSQSALSSPDGSELITLADDGLGHLVRIPVILIHADPALDMLDIMQQRAAKVLVEFGFELPVAFFT